MYVCICNAVTESDIHNAVDRGARNLKQLELQTGCSTGCGRCIETAVEVLSEALLEKRKFLRIVSSQAVA